MADIETKKYSWNISDMFTKVFLIILVVFLIGFNIYTFIRMNDRLNAKDDEAMRTAQNMAALHDSIKSTFNKKLNQFEYDKASYILTKEDLFKYNKDLANEFSMFKGDVLTAIRAEIKGVLPNVQLNNALLSYGGGSYGLKWNQDQGDAWFKQHIEGISRFNLKLDSSQKVNITPGTTELSNNFTTLKIKFAHTMVTATDSTQKFQVEAICQSPYVKLESLDGAYFIDSKFTKNLTTVPKSRWGFGIYGGYGVSLADKQIWLAPSIGIGIQYKFYWSDIKYLFKLK